jgi:hypothetical protein
MSLIKKLSSFAVLWGLYLSFLFILTLPFSFSILPEWGTFFSKIFAPFTKWIGSAFLGFQYPLGFHISSDTQGLVAQVFWVSLFSFALVGAGFVSQNFKNILLKFSSYIHLLLLAFLSLLLFKYGFDKLFKSQFYMPEPNILHTPLGMLSKDILYWSTIGTSRSYNLFLGIAEIIPAALILFHRTRFWGLVISIFVLLNVLVINFSFGISVKLLSSFLLLIAVFLFILHNKKVGSNYFKRNSFLEPGSIAYIGTKSIVIGLLLLESLFVYFQTGNFNDDSFPRPPFHGAYKPVSITLNSNEIRNDLKWKHLFVHRNGYFIIQNHLDSFFDIKMKNTVEFDLNMQGLNFRTVLMEESQNGIVRLFGVSENKDTLVILASPIDLNQLPVMQKNEGCLVD